MYLWHFEILTMRFPYSWDCLVCSLYNVCLYPFLVGHLMFYKVLKNLLLFVFLYIPQSPLYTHNYTLFSVHTAIFIYIHTHTLVKHLEKFWVLVPCPTMQCRGAGDHWPSSLHTDLWNHEHTSAKPQTHESTTIFPWTYCFVWCNASDQ